MPAANAPRSSTAGFTLIELLVALVLFALISLAGVSLIETTANIAQRSSGRAERLAQIERALYLLSADFEQLTAGPDEDSARLSLTRASSTGDYAVSYYLADSAIHRVAAGTDRVILPGVTGLTWRFFRNGRWDGLAPAQGNPMRPAAVEVGLTIAAGGLAGPVRRVIALPAEP